MAAPALTGVSGVGYYGSAGGSPTVAITGSMTTTAGRGMVAVLVGQDATAASFSDSKGNTWANAGTIQLGNVSGFAVYAQIGYCANITTGGSGHTVTGTTTTDGYSTIVAFEVDQAIAFDAQGGADVNASPWASSITTGVADTLAVAGIVFAGTSGWTLAASGWTWFGEVMAGETVDWDLGLLTRSVASAGAAAISVTPTGGGTGSEATIKLASFKAASGGGTNLTPGEAAIALSGPAPTLAQTANQSLAPAEAAIALSGPAPTIAQSNHQNLTPGEASIVLSGDAPTITQTNGLTLTPDTAALVLSGDAPTVAQSANQVLTPDPAAVVLSGPVPVVAQSDNRNIEPAQADVVLSGPIPTITQAPAGQNDLFPGEAALTLTGWEPAIVQSGQRGMEVDFEAAPGPRRAKFVSIKPPLQAALESRLPEPEPEELAPPLAANGLSAGIQALQNEQLTPELVERLAQQWRPAAAIAPNARQDAQLQYLRALMAEKQAQEAQAAQLDEQRRRAKAKADDEEAIAHALALLF